MTLPMEEEIIKRWKLVPDGSGNFYIIVKSTQLYLATENNSTADGVKVVQRAFTNSNELKSDRFGYWWRLL